MTDDEYRNGFGDENAPAETEKTEKELADEEAKAEEEFISTPEDTVENPLVPEEPKEVDDSEDEDRLKGAIGSGNLEADYPEEEKELVNNEDNFTSEPAAEAEAPVEETPVEETAAETPVEEVVTGPAITTNTPVTEANPFAVANPATSDGFEPKKKSKAGLIVTLVVLALLLIGGGVGFFVWMSIAESSENILKDALAKVWTVENIQMTGSMELANAGNNYEITFDGAKAGGNLGGSGKIKGSYSGTDFSISFSSSYIKGGEAYVKLDGLKDVLDSLNLDSLGALAGEDTAALLSSMLGAIVKKVDGQWYKITAADIKDYDTNGSMSCMLESIDGAISNDTMKKVADIYKKHPFIEVDKKADVKEEDGVKYITVTVNKDESKKFADEAKEVDSLKKLAKCADSSEEKDKESKNPKVVLGVKPWSHELVSASIESEGENAGKMNIKMTYDKKDISAPSDAKKLSTLSTDIEKAVQDALEKYIDKACQQYAAYGQTMVDYCKQAAMQQMGGSFDMSQLFGGFLGGGSETIKM